MSIIKKRGRPKLGEVRETLELIHFKTDAETRAALDLIASLENIERSAALRSAVLGYARHLREDLPQAVDHSEASYSIKKPVSTRPVR
jgi:hypothetical protein